MNILFVNTQFKLFDNLDSGAANRSTMFIRALAHVAHVDVITFRGKETSNIPNCNVVYCEHVDYNTSKCGRVAKYTKLLKYRNPESIFSVDRRKEEIVDRFLAEGSYDYIAVRYMEEMASCGLWKYAGRIILDIDDHPRNAMLVRMKMCRKLHNRLYIKLLSKVVSKTVCCVADRVHCSFYSNIQESPSKKSVYLHNVTITQTIVPAIMQTHKILIVGWLDYFPNREGVSHFVDYVYPLIRQSVPDVQLVLCGKLSDDNLKSSWNSIPGISVKGFVADLASEYADCSVVAVPLYTGSGTSVKVIEAMTMNRPCVTTSVGIRGIDAFAKEFKDYLLAKDDEDFAKKIIDLLVDTNRAQDIADSARCVINNNFSQEAFIKVVERSI